MYHSMKFVAEFTTSQNGILR